MHKERLSKIIRNKFVFEHSNGEKTCASELNSLLNEAKRKGVGYEENQVLYYTPADLERIKNISNFWASVTKREKRNYRTADETRKLFKRMIEASKLDFPVRFVLILCPAYKKGRGEYGFKDTPGRTTGELITYLTDILNTAHQNNIKALGEIWFSDLLIENHQRMEKNYIEESLSRNYGQIAAMLGATINIKLCRLSDIGKLSETIGIAGSTKKINIPKIVIDRVKKRSSVFYYDILGWSEDEVEKRVTILASAYELIGKELNSMPDAIMIFGEKNLERGKMYSGDQTRADCVPIIYPRLEEK